jgi:hypothetical protein
MSKESIAALLLIEAARRSYQDKQQYQIYESHWDAVCADPQAQRLAIGNLDPNKGILSSLLRRTTPTREDFEALRLEYRTRLSFISRMNEIQALFHAFEAERLLIGDVDGALAETFEDIAWERITEELETYS